VNPKNVRSPLAREILEFIVENYETLPFCERWMIKKFGTKALLGLKQLESNGNLHQFTQLVESSNSPVAQTEHTMLVEIKETILTTK
jgi:methionyl aminopeptidase